MWRKLLVIVGVVAVAAANTQSAAAQGAKAKPKAPELMLAYQNLERGYSDLLSTPPDVRGDTSKLEGHLKAAMDALHEADPAAIPTPPSNIPVMDKGHTRQFILEAVQGHLVKAKDSVNSAKIHDAHTQKALQNIAVAETDLSELGSAPVKK